MTIITLNNGCDTIDFAERLLCYEAELSLMHLHMRCIAVDEDHIHLEVPTKTRREHDLVVRIAKEIFRSDFLT